MSRQSSPRADSFRKQRTSARNFLKRKYFDRRQLANHCPSQRFDFQCPHHLGSPCWLRSTSSLPGRSRCIDRNRDRHVTDWPNHCSIPPRRNCPLGTLHLASRDSIKPAHDGHTKIPYGNRRYLLTAAIPAMGDLERRHGRHSI